MEQAAYIQQEEEQSCSKYLTFAVGEEEYGLDISQVTEIIGMQRVSALPEMPSFICGVVNLRGKVFPVIDMHLRFKKVQRENDERTCIIVVEIQGITTGLVVDCVLEVADLCEKDIAPPPDACTGIVTRYLQGMGKQGERVILLLDAQTLFLPEELESIPPAMAQGQG